MTSNRAKKTRLILDFITEHDKPMEDFSYHLQTNDGLVFTGRTDRGRLKHRLSALSRTAKLTIDDVVVEFSLGVAKAPRRVDA